MSALCRCISYDRLAIAGLDDCKQACEVGVVGCTEDCDHAAPAQVPPPCLYLCKKQKQKQQKTGKKKKKMMRTPATVPCL